MHAIAAENIRPLKRVEYEQLVDLGTFGEEQVELVYGVIVRMSPIGTRHAAVVTKLTERLVLALHTRALIRPALPFEVGDISLPQPDFAVVPRAEYATRHPSTAVLLVEVSESSLAFDRGLKRKLYAESNVPEYWVVNLIDSVIEVYDLPENGSYTRSATYAAGESIQLGAFPDVSIAVSDVM